MQGPMTQTKSFLLPDLGEGLPDATIVEWYVKEGDTIRLDDNLVSMETAKAAVDVPSPVSGRVLKLAGAAGDVINTGAMLAQFELDPSQPQRAEGQDTGHHHGAPAPAKGVGAPDPAPDDRVVASTEGGAIETGGGEPPEDKSQPGDERADSGTVVGAMQASVAVHAEAAVSVGGIKAMPAVRAMARKLKVELSRVRGSGADGVVTMADVTRAAADGTAVAGGPHAAATGQAQGAGSSGDLRGGAQSDRAHAPAGTGTAPAARAAGQRTPLSATGKPMRTQPPSVAATGQPEQLKGVRRNMARVMADAHARVVPTTLVDDADIQAWQPGNDMTVRLIRALCAAARAVPALNAWFDGDNLSGTLHPQVDIGIAFDTADGLFVPALRNADLLDAAGIRDGID